MNDLEIIEILKRNKEFKNYRDMCQKLNWKITSGTSKKAQFKELSQYCKWGKKGNKIIIYDIFENKHEVVSSGKYRNNIEILLIDLLARHKGNKIDLPIKNLLESLAMVNNNYIKYYDYEGNFKQLKEKMNIDSPTIEDTYILINNNLTKLLKRALDDLSNKSLIYYRKKRIICVEETIYKTSKSGRIMLDENDDPIILGTELIHKDATDDEIEKILKVEKEIMKEMGVNNKIFFNINWNAKRNFMRKVNKKLSNEYISNLQYYYDVYDIVYNSDNILKELESDELLSYRKDLNDKVKGKIDKAIDHMTKKYKPDNDIFELIELGFYTNEEIIKIAETHRVGIDYNKKVKAIADFILDKKSD